MLCRMLLVSCVLVGAMALVGCDKNKKTDMTAQAPAGTRVSPTVPPPPEPYTPAPAPEPTILFQEPVPAPAPRAVPAPAAPRTYTVKKGDTLIGIARKVYGDPSRYREIAAANSLSDPNKIKVGQNLVLP